MTRQPRLARIASSLLPPLPFYGLAVLGVLVAAAATLPPPSPGVAVTLFVLPGRTSPVIRELLNTDPDARLLGIRAGGMMIGIVYERQDMPALLGWTGALLVFGGGRYGCV